MPSYSLSNNNGKRRSISTTLFSKNWAYRPYRNKNRRNKGAYSRLSEIAPQNKTPRQPTGVFSLQLDLNRLYDFTR